MKNGYKVIDMDTHVQPPLEVLYKYVDPGFRPRLQELEPYRRPSVGQDGVTRNRVNVGAIPFNRFLGQAPREEDQRAAPGGGLWKGGRSACTAEPFEGPAMTKACIEILGEDVLTHQSDYPHGQSFFPETGGEVMAWPIWSRFSQEALRKHMYDNTAKFLRLRQGSEEEEEEPWRESSISR